MNSINALNKKGIAKYAKTYFSNLGKILDSINTDEIENFIGILLDARERRAKVFFIGNGGSAATATHFSNDLAIGTRSLEKPFSVMSLTDNNAVMTAIGNDFGYDKIFSHQLQAFGTNGDVVVAISASGNSPNLLDAFEYAKLAGLKTVAITAFDGGKLKKMADAGIHVPTELKEYGPAEDAHLILDHLVHGYLFQYIRGLE